MRRASTHDVDALIGICRQGFPDSLRWHGIRSVAVNWWTTAIDTEAAETWVHAPDDVISGVALLVIDRDLWSREGIRRKVGAGRVLASSLMHPGRAVGVLRKKIVARLAPRRNPISASTTDVPARTAWLEIIAVLPSMRGRGIARRLMEVCEGRTQELGCAAIGLCVDPQNESAIRLYETMGYVRGARTCSGWTYVKRLSQAVLPRQTC